MRPSKDISAERIARNDAAFRAANERILERVEEYGQPPSIPFLCECFREDCREIVWLTAVSYEEIRGDPRRFFNVPAHAEVDGEAALVVRRELGYVVVEKQGPAAEVVEALDPRGED
jgi:hypothetical protein